MIDQCLDMCYVKSFMTLPEVARYASEYGADIESEVFETTSRMAWLSFIHEGEKVGLIKFYLVSGCAAQFHPYILRKHKDLYLTMASEFFKWFKSKDNEQIVKLNVAIPTKFKNTIQAAIDGGMTIEGVDRLSYLSESGPCDRMLLGVTREELK